MGHWKIPNAFDVKDTRSVGWEIFSEFWSHLLKHLGGVRKVSGHLFCSDTMVLMQTAIYSNEGFTLPIFSNPLCDYLIQMNRETPPKGNTPCSPVYPSKQNGFADFLLCKKHKGTKNLHRYLDIFPFCKSVSLKNRRSPALVYHRCI